MSMSDFYYSRLLAAAREKRNVKDIKDIHDDLIVVELLDGSTHQIPWNDMFNYEHVIPLQTKLD